MKQMRDIGTSLPAIVIAAQRGDRRSLDELVSAHLPFVYTLVGRALGGHPDTDDVVQEVLLRAVRDLPDLRNPESFRAWLAAIAVRQVANHVHQRGRSLARSAPLESVTHTADMGADVEGQTVLRLEFSNQRAEVARASEWLDPDDRSLLSLWWLECGGRLTRPELARAVGVSVPHAAVRLQRMRGQVDRSRSVVAALAAQPRCARLDDLIADWDAVPTAVWRKRIWRHVRFCPDCTRAAGGRIPLEQLLEGSSLLAVPATLATGVIAKMVSNLVRPHGPATVPSPGDSAVAAFANAVKAHPIAAAFLAATLALGATAAVSNWPGSPPADPGSRASGQRTVAPAAPPTPAVPGPVSLEAASDPGWYVSVSSTFGVLAAVTPTSGSQLRQLATFDMVEGLANDDCFSFRLADGRYLRHSSWRLRVFIDDGSTLFRDDATFCLRLGTLPGSVSFESSNYPGWFLRHRGDELWVDRSDPTPEFATDTSFRIQRPLA